MMPMNETKIFSVTELTRKIKSVIETLPRVSVQGEISNFKRHTSGHLYFTLKDETTQIQAVMWRNRAVSLRINEEEGIHLEDGVKVIATGKVTVYEARGQYQIDVYGLIEAGIGELQLAFEQLKRKLDKEGLFDPSHRKPLPEFPQRIGIVTSPTGAAIHDLINILTRRFPCVEVLLYPVKVQGEGAAEEIVQAINDLNEFGDIDVMIIGRGGGSLEDLWAFNEEIVARAIYHSRIPIVSAVGHEIDYTIADFVADRRAPTPSAAAEIVVPDRRELIEYFRNFCYNNERLVENLITSRKQRISSILVSYGFNLPKSMLQQQSQRLDDLHRSLQQSVAHALSIRQEQYRSLHHRAIALNPDAVLNRGYAIVYREGVVVDRVKLLHSRDNVNLHFHDGDASAEIKESGS
jgi:exodeoxyribonuclease VII large subunit